PLRRQRYGAGLVRGSRPVPPRDAGIDGCDELWPEGRTRRVAPGSAAGFHSSCAFASSPLQGEVGFCASKTNSARAAYGRRAPEFEPGKLPAPSAVSWAARGQARNPFPAGGGQLEASLRLF